MKNSSVTTKNNLIDHTSFGGRIYRKDYDTPHTMSDIASRIIADWRFDKQCRHDAENRARKEENTIC